MPEENFELEKPKGDSDDQETVKLVQSLLTRSKRASAKARNKLKPNWEFVVDQSQWPHRLPKYRHQEVLNFTFSVIQSIIPMMTDNRPMVDVLPTEPEDRDFSVMLSGVLEDVWERLALDMKIIEAIFDAIVLGTSVTYVGWDKDAEDGLGNIDIEIVDPIYCYPDPNATEVNGKQSKFFIYTEPTFIGELKRRYPDKAEEIGYSKTKPDDTSRVGTAYYDWDDGFNPEDQRDMDEGQDDTLLIRCWIKSDEVVEEERLLTDGSKEYVKRKKFPNGRYVEICNGVVLKDEENEFKDKLFPFSKLVDHAIPRTFWGIGEVEMLKSPQRILNKIISWILDALNLTGKPIWIVDTSSQVDTDLLTNEPGLVIPKTPGSDVHREPGVEVPGSMFQIYQMTKTAFDMINGLGELSQGQKPSGVTSGVAIESLQEAAQNRIRQKNRHLEIYLKDLGKLMISRIMQFYTVPRMIRILNNPVGIPQFFEFSIEGNQAKIKDVDVDEEGQPRYSDLKTAPIKGFPDIRVAVGSSLPFAKQQKAQMAFQLFDRQIIGPDDVLEAIQYPNWEMIVEKQNKKMQEQAAAAPEGGEVAPEEQAAG